MDSNPSPSRILFYLILMLVLLHSSLGIDGDTIAAVSMGKTHTRLSVIRESPQSLVNKLNRDKGGKMEDIAHASLSFHQWTSLEHDFRRKEFFILDRQAGKLLVAVDAPGYINKTRVLYEGISSNVKATAYDWIRREFYWGDPSYQAIFRLSIGRMCRGVTCMTSLSRRRHSKTTRRRRRREMTSLETVVGEDVYKPYGMAVDPVRGYLYWSDDGVTRSIYSSNLEGHNRNVVVTNLIQPSGLTIDYTGYRLFWIDRMSTFSTVSSCDLAKTPCIPKQVKVVYESQLYDLDYYKGFLLMADQFDRLIIYNEDDSNDYVLRQKWPGKSYSVNVCSKDRQVYKDGPTFQPHQPKRGLVFSDVTTSGLILLASEKSGVLMVERTFSMGRQPSSPYLFLSETGITTMAVDVTRRQLFFFKRPDKTIYKVTIPMNVNESRTPIVISCVTSWIDDVTAMAVEWASGNLYWLDSGYGRLMMSNSMGQFPTVIHYWDISRPQDLVIHSNKRLLFWSDMSDPDPRIERSRLDGSHRRIILGKNDFYERPHALALDLRHNRLYWSDGPFLCRARLNGELLENCKPRDLMSRPAVKSIDIMHDYVIWTDFIGGLRLAETEGQFPLTGSNRGNHHWFRDNYYSDVVYVHTSKQPEEENPCLKHGRYPQPLVGSSSSTRHRNRTTLTLEDAVRYNRLKTKYRRGASNLHGREKSPLVESLPNPCLKHGRYPEPLVGSASSTRHRNRTTLTLEDAVRYHRLKTKYGSSTNKLHRGEKSPLSSKSSFSKCSQLCIPTTKQLPKCACTIGYWSKHGGKCVPGIIKDYFLVMTDDLTGKMFRQFALLPHYYAVPTYGDVQAFDVTLEESSKKLYWLDNRRHTNMIYSSGFMGENQAVVLAGTEFSMTSIKVAFNLLYILTSSGHVFVLCLTSGLFTDVINDKNVVVNSMFIDKRKRYLYLSAVRKLQGPKHTVFVLENTESVILRSNLDGSNMETVYSYEGKPMGLALHKQNLYWIDADAKAIFTIPASTKNNRNTELEGYTNSSTKPQTTNNNNKLRPDLVTTPTGSSEATPLDTLYEVKPRIVSQLGPTSEPREMIITPDGGLFFTDLTKQALGLAHVSGTNKVEDAGFPYLNKIGGIAYFDKRNIVQPWPRDAHCSGISMPLPGKHNNVSSCVCDPKTSLEPHQCKNKMNQFYRMTAHEQGLCQVSPMANGRIHHYDVNTYVMSGQVIKVSCTPGYLMSDRKVDSETRRCNGGLWNSTAVCRKSLGYHIHGDSHRGYVVFVKSMPYFVPRDVTRLDVICIGGGGGGYDPCDRDLFGQRTRAGMGGLSKFGNYLRAQGGYGGTADEGGRGGHSRNLFGGDGGDSSACLGGGAAGATRKRSEICRLDSTSCPFCGAGGALVKCNKCHVRPGGCSGQGSSAQGKEMADSFGGGATGKNGGWGGGGGGYSRKSIRVSPLEKVEVEVGRRGFPSAMPAADGVVVVAWGDVIENLVKDERGRDSVCKPCVYEKKVVSESYPCV